MEPDRFGKETSTKPKGWRRQTVLLAFLFATLIGVLEGTQVYLGLISRNVSMPWWTAFAATLPSWYVLAAMLPGIFWIVRRTPLDGGGWKRALVVQLPAAVVFSVVHLIASAYISDVILLNQGRDFSFGELMTRALSIYFILDVIMYLGIAGAFYAFDYYHKYREQSLTASRLELKASRLEASLAQANLQALRMQLNPHFLFNTLNAVSVLAMKGENDTVVKMVSRLSDLLRYALENDSTVVRLGEEMDLLQRYLSIEQIRFRDRLTVETNVDDDALGAEVPSLILQPLVENAIKHGLSRQTGAGKITIGARRENGSLELQVADSGPGLRGRGERSSGDGAGVGLANTRARLEQLYGDSYRFSLRDGDAGGAVVRVTIPYRPYEEI